MVLGRTEVAAGMTAEMAQFERLIRSLSDDQWKATTRCEGWVVSDAAGHVAGTLSAVAAGRFSEFTEPGHVEAQIAQRAGWSPKELADEYADNAKIVSTLLASLDEAGWVAPLGDVAPTVGFGMELLWFDTYVHGDDIRHALDLPSERGEGLRASVSHLTGALSLQKWGPASVTLDGLEPFEITGRHDETRTITGDPLEFVMAACGRLHHSVIGQDEKVNVYR